jgi:hypothetical protein
VRAAGRTSYEGHELVLDQGKDVTKGIAKNVELGVAAFNIGSEPMKFGFPLWDGWLHSES